MTTSELRAPNTIRSVRLVRAAWLVVVVASTAAWFGGPISQWTALQTVCHPDSACRQFQLDATAAATLRLHGISLTAFAVGMVLSLVPLWLLWSGVSALIILRRATDRGAVLASFFLILLPFWGVGHWIQSDWFDMLIFAVFTTMLFVFTLLFPDGRFQPRWGRWLALAIVAFMFSIFLPLPPELGGPLNVIFVGIFLAVIAVQIYRYRAVSSWSQKQQTKWGVSGLTLAILGFLFTWLVQYIAPFPAGSGSLYLAALDGVGTAFILSAIPLSIGVAVLRNRLWDIDHVINRALVYTLLSLILACIYIGGVLGLQALFRLVVGSNSTFAIALTTLAIVVLFGPVRRTIQTWIDRRFYRSKYDAQRTLAAFGESVRDEVDLARLSQGLTVVVRETLQPEHVSLWLRGGPEIYLGPVREPAGH